MKKIYRLFFLFFLALASCGTPEKGKQSLSAADSLHFQFVFPDSISSPYYFRDHLHPFGENYLPQNAFDSNDSTAWVFKTDTNATIFLHLDSSYRVYAIRLTVKNGSVKSISSYHENARAKSLALSDGKRILGTVALTDSMSKQQFEIALTAPSTLSGLQITVNDIYKGKSDLVFITDLSVELKCQGRVNDNAQRAHSAALLRSCSKRQLASNYISHPYQQLLPVGTHSSSKETLNWSKETTAKSDRPSQMISNDRPKLLQLFGQSMNEKQIDFIASLYATSTHYDSTHLFLPIARERKAIDIFPIGVDDDTLLAYCLYLNDQMLKDAGKNRFLFYRKYEYCGYHSMTAFSVDQNHNGDIISISVRSTDLNCDGDNHIPIDYRHVLMYDSLGQLTNYMVICDSQPDKMDSFVYYEFTYGGNSRLNEIKRWEARYEFDNVGELVIDSRIISFSN